MTQFQSDQDIDSLFSLDPKEEAVAHFVALVGRQLQEAFLHRKQTDKMTQQELAVALGVDRSRIHRCLSGSNNLTLETVAELVWAMRGEPQFAIALSDETTDGCNIPVAQLGSLRWPSSAPAATSATTFFSPSRPVSKTRTLELAK